MELTCLDQLNQKFKYKDLNHEDYFWSNTLTETKNGKRLYMHDMSFKQAIERAYKIKNLDGISGMEIREKNTKLHIKNLINNNKLKESFSILEMFGGTGIILYKIKKEFPNCQPIQVDILRHKAWKEIKIQQPDHLFYQINFINLIDKCKTPLNLDVLITYNTWRGWDVRNNNTPGWRFKTKKAGLRKISKEEFLIWAKNNFKHFIAEGNLIF